MYAVPSSQGKSRGSSLKSALLLLLPSFLLPRLPQTSEVGNRSSARVSQTLYLDGLRGVFSFIVFIRHFLVPWEHSIDSGFAQKDHEISVNSIFKLPFIRIFYSGPTVPIFFVVSGFLLAHKPLTLIHNGDEESLFRAMTSSIFRRAPRLFLPPMISTFLVAIAVFLGIYGGPHDKMPGSVPNHPERFDTIAAQLMDWARFVTHELTQLWSWKHYEYKYDTHLYTIPIQFRSSIIVFVLLIGLSRVTHRLRIIIFAFLWLYMQQQRRWDVGLFVAGVLIRAVSPLAEQRQAGISADALKGHTKKSIAKDLGWHILFALGMYLGSFPRGDGAAASTPGYMWLSTLTGKFVYWHSYGATAVLFALSNNHSLQKLFMNPFFYYLGKISFSLYLVHGPLLHIFGYSVAFHILSLVDQNSSFQYQLAIMASLLCATIPIIWVADLFWRLVDLSCGTLVARLERACFVSKSI